MFRGFPDLKALGDKLGESVRELEASLSQPVVSGNPNGSPSSKQRPSSSQPQPQQQGAPNTATTTTRQSTDSTGSTTAADATSKQALTASPRSSFDMAAAARTASSATQSASQLADSALSSLRMSLRKGRQSLEGSAQRQSTTGATPASPLRKEQELMPVSSSTTTQASQQPSETSTQPVEDKPVEEVSVPLVEPEPSGSAPNSLEPTAIDKPTPVDAVVVEAAENREEPSQSDANETATAAHDGELGMAPHDEHNDAAQATTDASEAATQPVAAMSAPLAQDNVDKGAIVSTTTSALSEEQQRQAVSPADRLPVPSVETETVPAPLVKEGQPAVAVTTAAVEDTMKALEQLHTLKQALDRVVAELIGLSTVDDVEAFAGELRSLKSKSDMSESEVQRLSKQLEQQRERIEELRDTHRLETKSQVDTVDNLRDEIAKKNTELAAAQERASRAEQEAQTAKASLKARDDEHSRLQTLAKEEEEKKTKALSLLRALRQKLTKTEKEKEDAERALADLRKTGSDAQEGLKGERVRFDAELSSLRAQQESQLSKMRASFDRELANVRAQHEREWNARKSQSELEVITLKSAHSKDLAARDAKVAQVEQANRDAKAERDRLFEQVQMKTAEVESARSHTESLESRASEMKFELDEARGRLATLSQELEAIRTARASSSSSSNATRDDQANARRMLAEAESRHDAKLRDMEDRLRQLERDRQEGEEEMSKNLQDRLREIERMRGLIAQKDVEYRESVSRKEERDAELKAKDELAGALSKKVKSLESVVDELRGDLQRTAEAEAAAREELSEHLQRFAEIESRLDEVSRKESSLRSTNKTLKEELRKLQSGVLLSEKQRHPGVGYFASLGSGTSANQAGHPQATPRGDVTSPLSPDASSASIASMSMSTPTTNRSRNGSTNNNTSVMSEEQVNFEYLRNVILQFLERPEMRSHLVQVLGVVLHFTPAELRRLASKV